jgi:cysteine synthase A
MACAPAAAIGADLTAAIGNTPLVRLRRASELTGCTILGKCEFMNPGGSVKDRAALGGTLSGVGLALKERSPRVVVALADPLGAAMFHWFRDGKLESRGSSVVEGIGQGRVTANVDGAPVDVAFQIPDDEALPLAFSLLAEEGLCVGGSSAVNVAGAIRLARELGPGHVVATIHADHGSRYRSKLYDPAFLAARGLPLPPRAARDAA